MTDLVTKFLSLVEEARPAGPNQWMAKCPAHSDEHPSLSVSRGEDDRLLARCHTGCEFESILSTVGWNPSDAFPGQLKMPPRAPIRNASRNGRTFPTVSAAVAHVARSLGGSSTGIWVYQDSVGDEVFRVARFVECRGARPKQYCPLHLAADGWHIADPPGLLLLYGLPELTDATTVWICEGEKCVEIFRELGLIASTNAHGAKAANKADWGPLAGKLVILCPDHDTAGETHAKNILGHLGRLAPAPTVKVVRLPVTNEGDDVEQFVEARRAGSTSDDDIRRGLDADCSPADKSSCILDGDRRALLRCDRAALGEIHGAECRAYFGPEQRPGHRRSVGRGELMSSAVLGQSVELGHRAEVRAGRSADGPLHAKVAQHPR